MMGGEPHPEVFLQADRIFDTQVNYAHELLHAFNAELGPTPHWFNESTADVAYVDSEIELWERRLEQPFLEQFDRIDHRSYELLQLRARYGADYFPRVYRALAARLPEARRVLATGSLEERNLLLLEALSEAAGEDLEPLFRKEFGFNPARRERQRGY